MSTPSGRLGKQAKPAILRFGEIARQLGFIDDAALGEALRRQKARAERGESHKLLGLILLELGHIDNEQLIAILRRYDEHREGKSVAV